MATDPIGVAGLGYLGRGIAACFLAHGFRVIGYTVGRDTHEIARQYIASSIAELIEKAHFPSSLAEDWQARYIPAPSLSDFAPCQFVVESVLEDFAIKQRVFDEIEAVVGPEIPITSNTSGIPITALHRQRDAPR